MWLDPKADGCMYDTIDCYHNCEGCDYGIIICSGCGLKIYWGEECCSNCETKRNDICVL